MNSILYIYIISLYMLKYKKQRSNLFKYLYLVQEKVYYIGSILY